MSKWAADNNEGQHAYVVTSYSWGRESKRIEYAANLTEAKQKYGWTQMRYTTVKVRRATPEDVTA